MQDYIRIVEAEEELAEQSRAPLYHATGPYGLLQILRSRKIKGSAGSFVSTTRDAALRYYWSGDYEDSSDAPFQLVLDADAMRSRFKMRPFDYAADDGHVWKHNGSPRKEREERVYAPEIPVDPAYVKAIIFEPVTARFLDKASHIDSGYLSIDPETRQPTGIRNRVYYEIEHRARDLGIQVIDRRAASSR